jgi:hypothetical protein
LNPTKYFNIPHICANIWKFISAEVVFQEYGCSVLRSTRLAFFKINFNMDYASLCVFKARYLVLGIKISYAFLIAPIHNNIS